MVYGPNILNPDGKSFKGKVPLLENGSNPMSPLITRRRVLGGVGIFATLGCVGAAMDEGEVEPEDTQAEAEENPDSGSSGSDEPQREVHSAGESFVVGGGDHQVEYTVNDFDTTQEVGSEYSSAEASGEFVVVNLTVTNVGSESFRISSRLFTLVDGEEREYDVDDDGQIYMEDALSYEQLHPDLSESGDVAFDVPPSQSERLVRFEPAGVFSIATEHYVRLE